MSAPAPFRWLATATIAALFDGAVLAGMIFEIVTTGNITLEAHGRETADAFTTITMLAGLSCNLACVARLANQWRPA